MDRRYRTSEWDSFKEFLKEDEGIDNIHTINVVCPICDGRGKFVNPAIDEYGISSEEMYEDPDFAESYFSGVYDQICGYCFGNNVVPEPTDEKVKELWYDWQQSARESDAIREQEMRMGA